ncbi:protein of unknown function (plasmid) [Rhodovastum atsumiense]|nr:protein of unknown function [Rhodovastum atsumiense]
MVDAPGPVRIVMPDADGTAPFVARLEAAGLRHRRAGEMVGLDIRPPTSGDAARKLRDPSPVRF